MRVYIKAFQNQSYMWRLFNSSVQGRCHIREDIPCQDKTIARCFFDNTYAIALSDGAGSARLSEIGAQITCETVVRELANGFDCCWNSEDLILIKKRILSAIIAEIIDAANECNNPLNEYASTLLAVVVKDDKYIAIHIGDGVIGCIRNQKTSVISAPSNGEFANVTTFVTSASALENMRLYKGTTDGMNMFVLFSDGAQQCLYNKATNELAPAIDSIYRSSFHYSDDDFQIELDDTLAEVIRNETMDDCSIALLICADFSLVVYSEMTIPEKKKLFAISANDPHAMKRLAQVEKLVCYLKEPHTISEASTYTHIKYKYLKKRVKKLQTMGLLTQVGYKYKSMVLI